MMKTQKFWLFLVGAVLLVSAVAGMLVFRGRTGAATASLYQDGECIRTIALDDVNKPFSFTVEWEDGCNVIEVERGRIRVAEADCPDQVCVRQGWISNSVVPIACLPHRLVIQLESAGSGVDGVAG